MATSSSPKPSLCHALRDWWGERLQRDGVGPALRAFLSQTWGFLRDSTPEQRRSRYGDADYDWDHHVDTTSATVAWRDRLLGVWHSPYQPTEPALFYEMLSGLSIDYRQFTFIDLGSGKGRVLLMASDYPFREILGIELLPEFDRIARQNLYKYKSDAQKCFHVRSLCGDAREFVFSPEPTVLYLFNPVSESGLLRVISNLELSLRQYPRPVYVLYHNPLLEQVLARSDLLRKIAGTHQYAVYKTGCRVSATAASLLALG
jgi:SAM-dependent methyltransferase